MGYHFLLQGIFRNQGLDPPLLHCRRILYCWATGEPLRQLIILINILPIPLQHLHDALLWLLANMQYETRLKEAFQWIGILKTSLSPSGRNKTFTRLATLLLRLQVFISPQQTYCSLLSIFEKILWSWLKHIACLPAGWHPRRQVTSCHFASQLLMISFIHVWVVCQWSIDSPGADWDFFFLICTHCSIWLHWVFVAAHKLSLVVDSGSTL